jgi:hypothetical protein
VTAVLICRRNTIMGKEMDKVQHCDIRITKMDTTFWKKLHTPNTWIYSTIKEEEITVSCIQEVYRIDIINETSVMTLQPEFTVRTMDIEIIGK